MSRFFTLLILISLPSLTLAQLEADTMNVATCEVFTGGWSGTCPDNIDENPPGDGLGSLIISTTANDTVLVTFDDPTLGDIDSVQLQWQMRYSKSAALIERIGWDTSGTWTTTDVQTTTSFAVYTMSITGSPDSLHVANLQAIGVLINDNNREWEVSMICAIAYFTPAADAPDPQMIIIQGGQ